MSDQRCAVLAALRALTINGDSMELRDWRAVAREAFSGSAPAQYIVATGFEELGNAEEARKWYARSAAQGFLPAISKLARQDLAPPPDAPAVPAQI